MNLVEGLGIVGSFVALFVVFVLLISLKTKTDRWGTIFVPPWANRENGQSNQSQR